MLQAGDLPRQKYTPINDPLRAEIVKSVLNEKRSFRETAELFKLKCSSVRSIVRIYKNEGRTNKKKNRRHKLRLVIKMNLKINHPCINKIPLQISAIQDFLCDQNYENRNPEMIESIQSCISENLQQWECFLRTAILQNSGQNQIICGKLLGSLNSSSHGQFPLQDQCYNPFSQAIFDQIQNFRLVSQELENQQQALSERFYRFYQHIRSITEKITHESKN